MARAPRPSGVPDGQLPVQAVPDPILCNPYREPTEHWVYPGPSEAERAPRRMPGRRPASYWFTERKTGSAQDQLFREETRDDLPLVNRLREDVRRWRESGWRGASEVTKDLLRHWMREDRPKRLFFCQMEAAETLIYLLELRMAGLSSRTGFSKFECPDADLQRMLAGDKPAFYDRPGDTYPRLVDPPADPAWLGLRRLGCKMATGSGKTTVMAMLVAWAFCNRGRNPLSTGFPNAVLVCAPNLTVKSRLQVLNPEAPGNYYELFDLVPSRYRDHLAAGRVLVTNWHVFGRKSPHSDGGVTYAVVDKGEEDERAFTLARLGELASRLPLLVLNDEGHHCWRPKPGSDDDVDDESREEKKAREQELEEARVWLDGLDRINNSGLLGPRVPCVMAAVDLSATPFYLDGSGHVPGSPFPWLVSDFGLVDAIESGLVKVPRLPVLEEGGPGRADEAGRPDPKYFRLWKHIVESLKPGDKAGRRIKPEAVYREAESALKTLAGQWHQRFKQYREASATQTVIPPAMIIVCHETEVAQHVYRQVSGEREEEVPTPEGGTEVRTVYGDSKVLPELANTAERRHTLRIDSDLLARLEGDADGTRDQKAAEVRRIIDTVGKPGQPGEHIRCVVSVSMLTEGWDANNVTQILGIRKFGTQLLCEQVVGRGLRRRSYRLNERGLLDPEYVDVYGIPFTLIPFKGRPKDEPAAEDKPQNHVRPVPGRAHLEIRAPRVEAYVYDLHLDGVACDVSTLAGFCVQDEPTAVYIDAVRGYRDQAGDAAQAAGGGEPSGYIRQDREAYYAGVHEQAIHFQMAQQVLDRLLAGAESGEKPEFRLRAKHLLFPQVLRIVQEYIATRVTFAPGVNRKEIGLHKYADRVVSLLATAITPAAAAKTAPLLPVLNRMRRFHTTADAEESTTLPVLRVERSHLDGVVLRSSLERTAAELLDRSPLVEAFTANSSGFGMSIPYADGEAQRAYEPDFIVRLPGGTHLLVEMKGLKGELHDLNLTPAKIEAAKRWVAAVNNARRYGLWHYEFCRSIAELDAALQRHATHEAQVLPFRKVAPAEGEKFRTCVPLLPLKVAAGQFAGSEAGVDSLFEAEEWVEPTGVSRLEPGMFVAQVRGRSMEPELPDGSWCLFRPDRGGSRGGRILLVAHHAIQDPAYSAGYTVKRYRSEKVTDPTTGEWRHDRITLEPLNRDFQPIVLAVADESEFRIIAELAQVLEAPAQGA